LYQYEKAITWLLNAEIIIFIGTSNSVGFTSTGLNIGINKNKKVIVVDPDPSPSFDIDGVELIKMSSSSFCKMYF
jgi:anaerobic selenocysteine-containing dehydrogenase